MFSVAFDNGVEPDHHDERIPLMTWQTCAFTVQAVVWAVLDQGKSIFDAVSTNVSMPKSEEEEHFFSRNKRKMYYLSGD